MDNRSKHPVLLSHMNMGYPGSLNKINLIRPYNRQFTNLNRSCVPSNSFYPKNLSFNNGDSWNKQMASNAPRFHSNRDIYNNPLQAQPLNYLAKSSNDFVRGNLSHNQQFMQAPPSNGQFISKQEEGNFYIQQSSNFSQRQVPNRNIAIGEGHRVLNSSMNFQVRPAQLVSPQARLVENNVGRNPNNDLMKRPVVQNPGKRIRSRHNSDEDNSNRRKYFKTSEGPQDYLRKTKNVTKNSEEKKMVYNEVYNMKRLNLGPSIDPERKQKQLDSRLRAMIYSAKSLKEDSALIVPSLPSFFSLQDL